MFAAPVIIVITESLSVLRCASQDGRSPGTEYEILWNLEASESPLPSACIARTDSRALHELRVRIERLMRFSKTTISIALKVEGDGNSCISLQNANIAVASEANETMLGMARTPSSTAHLNASKTTLVSVMASIVSTMN